MFIILFEKKKNNEKGIKYDFSSIGQVGLGGFLSLVFPKNAYSNCQTSVEKPKMHAFCLGTFFSFLQFN